MKTRISSLLFLAVLITTTAQSQWTGTSPVYTNSNVGIGHSSPSVWYGADRVLEIRAARPVLNLTSTTTLSTISFSNTSINPSTHTGEFHIHHELNTGDHGQTTLLFGALPTGNVFSIRADGHAAIEQNKHFRFRGLAHGETYMGFDVSTATLRLASTKDGYDRYITLGGINAGTSTWVPQFALNTRTGSVDASGNIVAGGTEFAYWQGFKSNAPSGRWGFQQNELAFIGVGGNFYNKGFSANAMGICNGSVTKQDVYLINQNSPNADFFVLTASGQVGIGTLNTDAKLTVAGDVHSREVRVTSTAGADFVFEDNYNLPKLEDVDKYIKANKHLPGIDPAEEMVANGIELGDMNIKLLQKVEEITLYLIELRKEVDDLRKENEALKKKIN